MENTFLENTLPENAISENTLSKNTLSENTLSKNTLLENTMWENLSFMNNSQTKSPGFNKMQCGLIVSMTRSVSFRLSLARCPALSGSLLLFEFAYKALAWLTRPLLGSQRRCCAHCSKTRFNPSVPELISSLQIIINHIYISHIIDFFLKSMK